HDAQLLLNTTFQEVLDTDIVHWPQGIPFATVGHTEQLKVLKNQLAAQNQVHVVGAWIAGTGLASVVGQARKVAQQLSY
ncbi:MAG: hypothetical protein QM632_04590, partial [Micrococcaceae bacterium]